jgi:F-type H+-transporting ATPase subunit b
MLNLDPITIAFQIVNFLVLAFVLQRLLFKPALRRAAERSKEQQKLQQELAEEREKAASLRAEMERMQQQVEEEAQTIRSDAQARADAEREELLAQVQDEAKQMLAQAQADAARMRQQALAESRDQVVDAILGISGTVIGRAAPPDVHDRMVSGLSERIRDLGRAEMQRVDAIRRSLGTREPIAHIVTARELSVEQRAQLAQMLTALADRHVTLELETEPGLVAGVRVRLGDTVMDNSIAGQLAELRDQVRGALEAQAAGG